MSTSVPPLPFSDDRFIGRGDKKLSPLWPRGARARRACFTRFVSELELASGELEYRGPGESYEQTDQMADDVSRIRYWIAQREQCPSTGRLHWQGYVEFHSPVSLDFVRRIEPHAVWSVCKGSAEANKEYCSKEETRDETRNGCDAGPWECGSATKQGARNDLVALMGDLKEGASDVEVAERYPGVWLRSRQSIIATREAYKLANAPRIRPMKVTVIWGPTGVGKSYRARELAGDSLYALPDPYGRWFDRYTGESNLLIDEFKCEVPIQHLNQICDQYKLQVAIKGGYVLAEWTHVYIVSNEDPAAWYAGDPHRKTLHRRISEVIHMATAWDGGKGPQPLACLGYPEPPPSGSLLSVPLVPLPTPSRPDNLIPADTSAEDALALFSWT